MRKRTYLYFEKDKALPCPAGDRMKDVNRLVRNGNNLSLEKTGELDVQEQIQSYEDGVSLEKMIKRFQRGDETALQRRQAFYADVSGYSTDPAEVIRTGRAAMQTLADLQAKNNEKPVEEKPAEKGDVNDANAQNE